MAGYRKGDISDLKSPKVNADFSVKIISENIKKNFGASGKP
jgi:hypothetical protein